MGSISILLCFGSFVDIEVAEWNVDEAEELIDAEEVSMKSSEDDLGRVALTRNLSGTKVN